MIVGAGAAGILLAIKLADKRKRVLVIESGHFVLDDERQILNEVDQSGKHVQHAIWGRKRVIGGTTTAWGGQSLPFGALDFAPREWVVNSGWPIPFDELARHYAAANAFMGVDQWNYDTDLFSRVRRPDPGFDTGYLRYHFSKWAPKPDFFRLYRHRLQRDVTVLYNAHLVRIDLSESGRASVIEVANFAGRTAAVPVNMLVLAAGGIETNRILLLNDHQMPGGLGNHCGWLGKAFMEHPCLDAGIVEPTNMRRLQQTFGTRMYRLRKYSVRLSVAERRQRERCLLNASAGIMWIYPHNQVDPFAQMRQFVRERQVRATANVVFRSCGIISRSAWALAKDGFIYKPGTVARLVFMTEQEPTTRSYIGLSERTDRFGARLARLNWHITDKTWRTVVHFAQDIAREIERLELGRVMLPTHICAETPDWRDYLSDVNHHMGGTRMSSTMDQGVVNADLQVWKVPNLYVCSTSVFPTGSHSNPTLTLLALGARLAEKLSTE